MNSIGAMAMPADFKYREVFLRGRPRHDRLDAFSLRHPRMDPGKRAKIFAPFDALRGFNFAVSRKEVRYEEKPELSREQERALNGALTLLRTLTGSTRLARQNRVRIRVEYFVPCPDPEHEAFGSRGQIRELCGLCRAVDPEVTKTIRVDDTVIAFDDLLHIAPA